MTTLTQDAAGLFVDGASLVVPAGTDRIRTSGYRKVGQGSADYFRWATPLAPLPAPAAGENAWWFTDANGGKWYPDPTKLNFYQFGARGDYDRATETGTDDYPAWLAFRSFAVWARRDYDAFDAYQAVPTLRFTMGHYRSSDTFDCDFGTLHLLGERLGAQNGGNPVVITFDAGKTGIRIHYVNTEENTSRPQGVGGIGTVIENIKLRTPGSGGVTDADGFRIRAHAALINCSAEDFIRHGVHIMAAAGGGGALEGNANGFRIVGGNFRSNGMDGIFIDSADANAGVIDQANGTYNGRWGIYDSSFLGNTITGCHTDGNGTRGESGPRYAYSTKGALVTHQGKRYSVVPGQAAAASTTVPGTNPGVWHYLYDGGGHTIFPAWTSGMQLQEGGAYRSDDDSSRTIFIGCYSEGTQGPSWISQNSMCVGGLHAAGIIGASLNAEQGCLATGRLMASSTNAAGQVTTTTLAKYPNELLRYGGTNAPGEWTETLEGDGSIVTRYMGFDGYIPSVIVGPGSNFAPGGRPAPHQFVTRFPYGFYANLAFISSGSGAPTSGAYGTGSIVFNETPSAGGKVGWVCVAAGSPGTWKAFGPIDA